MALRLAKADEGLSSFIRTTTLLDTASESARGLSMLPASLRSLDTPAVFIFDDIHNWAERFGLRVLDWLLQGPARGPRLVVDVASESVTFDGKTFFPGPVVVHILHELAEARGRTVSRAEMRKNRVLAEQERLDRDIKKLKRDLKIDIVTVPKKGFRLPEEYLA
jgi:hypothetical protein